MLSTLSAAQGSANVPQPGLRATLVYAWSFLQTRVADVAYRTLPRKMYSTSNPSRLTYIGHAKEGVEDLDLHRIKLFVIIR